MFPLFALAAIALRARPWLAVAGAVALMAGLYTVFPLIAGFPLTKATIAWGALRIVPCFSLGCALYLAWRGWAADRRTAVAGAYVFGAAALVCAQFGAPDLLTVASFGGLIITLAQGSKTGATLGSSPILVYLGEVSYSVYMVCIPWMVLCTNVATKILHLDGKQLPLFAWLILLVTVVPVAAASHHLIERPARRWMKLWYESRQSGKFSAVSVR
jgi:peptidoglycan/LPS O-acetylase OafA/YrhL